MSEHSRTIRALNREWARRVSDSDDRVKRTLAENVGLRGRVADYKEALRTTAMLHLAARGARCIV
jgi:hypothetical protein